jgi:hypothetical protein
MYLFAYVLSASKRSSKTIVASCHNMEWENLKKAMCSPACTHMCDWIRKRKQRNITGSVVNPIDALWIGVIGLKHSWSMKQVFWRSPSTLRIYQKHPIQRISLNKSKIFIWMNADACSYILSGHGSAWSNVNVVQEKGIWMAMFAKNAWVNIW